MARRKDGKTNARQKLWEALQSLVGEGPLRARLTHVIHPMLQLVSRSGAGDPIAVKAKTICDELTKTPAMLGEHYLPRSHISAHRAKRIAQEILDLYTEAQGGL